jgi:hypothetical protein
MGSLFKSSTTQAASTAQQNTQGAPWQQQNLQNLSSDAQGIYNSQVGNTDYTGQLYNPINQAQTDAATNLSNSGAALSSSLGGLLTAGQEGVNGMSGYMSGATALANGNFNQGSTTAGTTAANNVGNTVNATNTGINGALSMAANPGASTTAEMNTAQQYASNPALQSQIQANTQQIANTLNNSTLPSLNAQAISAGGLNSSRAGAASAIAGSQAEQNAQSYAANLENNAYNTGASMGENAQSNALSGYLGGASAGTSATNAGVSGMTAANDQTNANNNLQAQGTTMLGNGASLGSGLLSSYGTDAGTAGNLQYSGGGILQNDGQMQDNAALQQYQMNMNTPWQLLQNLQNIQGGQGNIYGSSGTGSSTQKTTTNPSAMSDIGSGIGMLSAVAAM